MLAERGVRLSESQVWRLVTGKPERLNLHTLMVLCAILECTPNDLIERVELPQSLRLPSGPRGERRSRTSTPSRQESAAPAGLRRAERWRHRRRQSRCVPDAVASGRATTPRVTAPCATAATGGRTSSAGRSAGGSSRLAVCSRCGVEGPAWYARTDHPLCDSCHTRSRPRSAPPPGTMMACPRCGGTRLCWNTRTDGLLCRTCIRDR